MLQWLIDFMMYFGAAISFACIALYLVALAAVMTGHLQ